MLHDLFVLKKNSPTLKSLKDSLPEPSIHGYQVWGSSFLIMDYLLKHPLPKRAGFLDIGCGWGMLSVFCAKHFSAKVTAVDADEWVFPYLRVHAAMNQVAVTTLHSRYEDVERKLLKKQKLMAGGDICFWDELVEPLYNIISAAVEASVDQIIIADPGRSPFMKLARRCKKSFNATLEPYSITQPKSDSGYLLIIKS